MSTYTSSFLSVPPIPPPSQPSDHRSAELSSPCWTAAPHSSAFYAWCGCVSVLLPRPVPSSPSPAGSMCPFSTSASLFLPRKQAHQYHFFRFHIYALIHNIGLSLSDLLHSVRQTPVGPSTSLQVTQFPFLQLSNVPSYMCPESSLSVHLLMDV